MRKFKFLIFFIIVTLILGTLSVARVNQTNIQSLEKTNDDFYFVQLTDTDIKHKIVDFSESTIKKLNTVLEKITSFEDPPAFIVITGDLCEWAGNDPIGALNCEAFLSCFYEENDQLYADSELTIPVYTIPGNHDYNFGRNLVNYHKYIDKNHIADEDRYILTYNDLSLFFMDSGPNYYEDPFDWLDVLGDGLYDDDIDWLEKALDNCTFQHKIVLMHHPAINDRNDVGEMHNVIARNREEFVNLCESYDVDIVLAGHTHRSVIFDSNENKSYVPPLNCGQYPTLFVQSDDCKQGIHYRNISFTGNDLWIEGNEELKQVNYEIKTRMEYIKIYNLPLKYWRAPIEARGS